jgi:hypothetical protein
MYDFIDIQQYYNQFLKITRPYEQLGGVQKNPICAQWNVVANEWK